VTNEIILEFDFETPPAAEDLGELFVALDRDYRKISKGGTLVVTRVESGSIIITITDAVLAAAPYVVAAGGAALATMAAINTIAKFAENIKTWFGRATTDQGKKRLYKKGKKAPGQRSVEAIIRTAAKTRSHVEVKHTRPNGETLEAKLTPAEAINVSNAEDDTKVAKLRSDIPRALAERPEIRTAIKKLQEASSSDLSVVDIIVSVLQTTAAGQAALPEIASHLEKNGLFDLAVAVRQHIRGRGGAPEPPLTTL
jgi:hypothetical protein